jgi:hypothetical protein
LKENTVPRSTVAPVKNVDELVVLLSPAPAMLHVTTPPALPNVADAPHLPPKVVKSVSTGPV